MEDDRDEHVEHIERIRNIYKIITKLQPQERFTMKLIPDFPKKTQSC